VIDISGAKGHDQIAGLDKTQKGLQNLILVVTQAHLSVAMFLYSLAKPFRIHTLYRALPSRVYGSDNE
jgi:hypothetical protein